MLIFLAIVAETYHNFFSEITFGFKKTDQRNPQESEPFEARKTIENLHSYTREHQPYLVILWLPSNRCFEWTYTPIHPYIMNDEYVSLVMYLKCSLICFFCKSMNQNT